MVIPKRNGGLLMLVHAIKELPMSICSVLWEEVRIFAAENLHTDKCEDPQFLFNLLYEMPWHADTLLQAAEVFRHREGKNRHTYLLI